MWLKRAESVSVEWIDPSAGNDRIIISAPKQTMENGLVESYLVDG